MRAICFLVIGSLLARHAAPAADRPRPLMRDFMGINGHTVQFRPALYAPVAKLVRDYHPIAWDLGKESDFATNFPMARNRVDWSQVYGSWKKSGLRVDASLMFDNDFAAKDWKDMKKDAAAYGEAFARYFGPSGKDLVQAAEIGNEPGKYADDDYRKLFTAMAGGLRKGDPKLRIATCAANLGPSGSYSKSVDLLTGLEPLYDVINIHLYAEVEGWPTWRRSYPEDPGIKFLQHLNSVLTWRREHAADKEVWLTEFGWDASTKPAPATGTFAKWEGSTETQQAQWIVRAWLVFASTDLDRAYLYFFNDKDEPQVHGSSGLTRNFEPKPAYHAAAWLQHSLGDYRFAKTIRASADDGFASEFTDDAGQRIVAVWKPSGADATVTLPVATDLITRAERMPLSKAPPEPVTMQAAGAGSMQIEIGETPILLWLGGS